MLRHDDRLRNAKAQRRKLEQVLLVHIPADDAGMIPDRDSGSLGSGQPVDEGRRMQMVIPGSSQHDEMKTSPIPLQVPCRGLDANTPRVASPRRKPVIGG